MYNVMDEETATCLWSNLEILYMIKSLSNKLYLKKQLYGYAWEDNGVEASELLNKIISELLVVDVKIDEGDKALILLNSLSESYDHIVTTIIYEKETLILKEVMTTVLSKEIRKRPNQDEQEGSDLVVMEKKWEKKSGFVEGMLFLLQWRSLKERLQASTRVVEKEGASCGGRHGIEQFRRNWSINGFLQR